MDHTEQIRMRAKHTTFLMAVHTVLYLLYNYSHGKVDLAYVMEAYTPILLLFSLAPVAAAIMLFTSWARWASVALLGMLPSALIYSIVTRFMGTRPLTIVEPSLTWKIIYEGSFGTALIVEVIAIWMVFKLLVEIHKQMDVE